jgi:hypothetical protein
VREQLEGWGPSRTRRKAAANKVSLILVDKTLDLASCVRYGGDSLLARATEMLRRRLFGNTTLGVSTSLVADSLASPWMDKEKEDLLH